MQRTAAHFGFTAPNLPDLSRDTREPGKLEPEAGVFTRELAYPLPGEPRKEKVKCRVLYRETIEEITFERYHPKSVRSLKLIEASPNYAFKFADRTSLNALLAQKGDCDEILITRNGLITDTSYSNVVFSRGERLFTPATPLLYGTKRQQLLQEGKIEEKEIAVATLEQYDRVYLINALLDIEDDVSLPVNRILK